MNREEIEKLEEKIGAKIPQDYADFLLSHHTRYLDPPLLFTRPESGFIDELLTIENIYDNSVNDCLGIPEKGLVHIGSNIMGGYLYIKLSHEGFGEVHYMENSYFKVQFASFSLFLESSKHEHA